MSKVLKGLCVVGVLLLTGCNVAKIQTTTLYKSALPLLTANEVSYLNIYAENRNGSYEIPLRKVISTRSFKPNESAQGIFCDVLPEMDAQEKDYSSAAAGESVLTLYARYNGNSVRQACGMVEVHTVQQKEVIKEDLVKTSPDNNISVKEYQEITRAVEECEIARIKVIAMLPSGHFTRKNKEDIDLLVLDCAKAKMMEKLNERH